MKMRKILSYLLVVLMLATVVFSTAVTSSASFDSDKVVVSSFSTMNHNYTKSEGWYNDIGYWGEKTPVSNTVNSDGSLTMSIPAADYNYFRQVMTNWGGVAATTQTAYIDITNNSTKNLRVIITVGGYTTPAEADLPKVSAGSTKTVELGVLTGGSFNIMFQEQYGGDLACGENLYTLSPIYTDPAGEEEETTVPTEAPTLPDGYELVYPFESANHNYSKSEGCNPNNNWAWGSFATASMNYFADGSVSFDLEAGAYDKYRQFQSNWRNVPAESETTYIDITNNSTRVLRVRVTTSGYTTPADADLPQVKAGETITIEIGALNGGAFGIMFLDVYGEDKVPCGEDMFRFSGIYKEKATEPVPVLYEVTVDGATEYVEEGAEFVLPINDSDAFIGYYLDEKVYSPGESVTVNENLAFESLYLDLSMESGAAFRLSNPSGVRFYTNIDKEQLETLENYGATVQLGTLITPEDYLLTEELTFDLSKLFVDVKFNTRNWFEQDSFSGFVGSIAYIKEGNLNRGFVGRGYATVTIGDFTKTVYANYYDNDIANNTRSICYIADRLKNSDAYDTLSADLKEIVDSFASKYVA